MTQSEAEVPALREPLAHTKSVALWSPITAVADPVAVVEALASRVRERGGVAMLGAGASGAGPGWVITVDQRFIVGYVSNAVGLYADKVAHWFGVDEEYRMLPFKGPYWYGS